MATIVQNYGPIYGEAVNGTVQGRPNGSVYVPISNTIELKNLRNATVFSYDSGTKLFTVYTQAVAVAQDLASYMQYQVYTDAGLTALVAEGTFSAGLFNVTGWGFAKLITGETAPDVGDTCYFRVQLVSSTGVPVATSEVLELERAA